MDGSKKKLSHKIFFKHNVFSVLTFSILDEWLPVMTRLAPAPGAVLHLVKCGCKKDRCANYGCKCRKAGLQCIDLCSCADNEEDDCCHNVPDEEENGDNEDDMEEYDDEVDDEVMDWEDARPRAIAY